MKGILFNAIEDTEVSLNNIIDQMSNGEIFDLINKLQAGCKVVFK